MKRIPDQFILFLQKYWLVFFTVIFAQLFYLIYSSIYYQIGFPLDDSWIHQTYAKNLFLFNEWYFIPGFKSAGSTSPLWTLMLVPGHIIGERFYLFWTFFISGILLSESSIILQKIFDFCTDRKSTIPWLGILFALEWHILWATNSGMETILYIFFILIFLYYFLLKNRNSIWIMGIILGLIIFVRPDGITLIGPILLVAIYEFINEKKTNKDFIYLLIIVIVFILGYGFFNYRLSGEILPNTFYAKQAEYEILFSQTILKRLSDLFLVPLTGVGIILLPGFLYFLYKNSREKNIKVISIYLWFFGYILIYANRLPVTYQHGRYMIPIIPVFFLMSFLGSYEINKRFVIKSTLLLGYKVLLVSILGIFFYLGGKAYAQDVAIIQSEMVETSVWVRNNLEKNAIIAAHDIGALGFFSEREIVDLAGLISPEIIPFIRDEKQLEIHLDEQNVDYLIIFPDWYNYLDNSKKEIYSSNGTFSPDLGGENMKIYIWNE
jgi:hypothetical protein